MWAWATAGGSRSNPHWPVYLLFFTSFFSRLQLSRPIIDDDALARSVHVPDEVEEVARGRPLWRWELALGRGVLRGPLHRGLALALRALEDPRRHPNGWPFSCFLSFLLLLALFLLPELGATLSAEDIARCTFLHLAPPLQLAAVPRQRQCKSAGAR